jgi:hypothetical protein
MEQFLPFAAAVGFAITRTFLRTRKIFRMFVIIDGTAWHAVLFAGPGAQVDHLAAL